MDILDFSFRNIRRLVTFWRTFLLQATTELHEEVAGWEKIRSKHAAAKKIDIVRLLLVVAFTASQKALFENYA